MNEAFEHILSNMKKEYLAQINYIGVDPNDEERFSWAEKRHLSFTMYHVFSEKIFDSDEDLCYIVVARPSKEDSLQIIDLEKETHSFEFEQLTNNEYLPYLISKQLVQKSEKIVPTSVTTLFIIPPIEKRLFRFKELAKNFAAREYKITQKELTTRNILEPFPVTKNEIFIDTYHFDDMLKKLNNNQFSDEFNQCLFAYTHEKWFLCAAGIGSCLEHLMLLILMNYNKAAQLGRNPTAKDYLKAFTRDPICLDARQQTYIDTLFRLRNSIDHHNAGITSKRICDMLLDGVTNVFNEYYVPSTN
ncbi:hypothetical protein QUD40_08545 [Levilactobacillus brevis]|nr:hypothetical protein [Levilactobacillus brevis]MDM7649299.1 hypothetical protein [Levilactobacillus brevis]